MDNIENRDGKWSFAFTGNRGAIWHRKGQELPDGASIEQWIDAAGLDFRVIKTAALAALPSGELRETPFKFLVREDTKTVFAPCTDQYQVDGVQPRDVAEWFDHYVAVDDRFAIDAAGVLGGGERVWMTARFNGDMDVAGDSHVARLLMSTSFDGSMATINQATMTRVVCQNTMRVAHGDKRAVIKTTHRSTFDGRRVARELAQIASTFDAYKKMGDALAQVSMSRDEVVRFLADVVEIPAGAKRGDTKVASTRKWNMFDDLTAAFHRTQRERNTAQGDAFTALNAVTRYVDHERSVRNADDQDIGRFDSATFGSGDALKGKALSMLIDFSDKREKVLVRA